MWEHHWSRRGKIGGGHRDAQELENGAVSDGSQYAETETGDAQVDE